VEVATYPYNYYEGGVYRYCYDGQDAIAEFMDDFPDYPTRRYVFGL
jgi:hypothetical protein